MNKKQLVFATSNPNKVAEVKAILEKYSPEIAEHYEILSLYDIGCTEDIPENASTFAGNAFKKAEFVHIHYNVDCFADDSGLEVRALGMEPGVMSARYANDEGFDHDSTANTNKLLRNMQRMKDRTAQFRTVIVLFINGTVQEFEGVCRGQIATQPSGVEGFGYDPIFRPSDFNGTFAEMSLEEKNNISHRGKAVRALAEWLLQNQ